MGQSTENNTNIEKAPEKVLSDIIAAFKQRGFEYNKEFGLGYNDNGDFIWFQLDNCTFVATINPLPALVD